MASSSGSASVAPIPLSTVRRGNDRLVMNMCAPRIQNSEFKLYHRRSSRTRFSILQLALLLFTYVPPVIRFWKGTLRTMPSTSDDMR
jgi:hypothetical protein